MHKKVEPKFGVITVSTSRYKALCLGEEVRDESGTFLRNELKAKCYTIVPDNREMIKGAIDFFIDKFKVNCIVLTGGTGLEREDVTIETLKEMFEKELEGFKIIFQLLSYEEVRFRTILSRATAGIYRKTLIYSLPGSLNACKLGAKIIKEESSHILGHVVKE
ncbi:molybdenum cofactor synthesis domain protein [Methanocaldococcus infernus ME]|uniref:Molybdenum cofactor synthesis domain protein n=1 Tax=Methanocaldococcus infernus (strain DSM 11812 / JCM 15783 / ME) TaxID=573063 RepID=D5VT02_METIM|nr:MogA/MoaB family molybdenum cofactor biosynthesis protein [Methanocaldococcus infernus]ADG13705.1 molybdenum cofactor synthesis domain protein [Methanocaldococcus infernus ME]